MRVRVQVIVEPEGEDDDQAPIVHEVASIERGDLSVATLGLQLAEAKDLLQKVQTVVINEQVPHPSEPAGGLPRLWPSTGPQGC